MWFTENPWPPIVICSVLAVFAMAGWYSQKRGIYLVGILCLVLLSGGIYIAEQKIVTEKERVQTSMLGMTSAFQKDDLEGTLRFISPRAVTVRSLVERGIQFVNVEDDLRITDVQLKMLAEETRATSHFRANATIGLGMGGNVGWRASRWRLTWQLEGGEWKVIRVAFLDVVNGRERQIPLAY